LELRRAGFEAQQRVEEIKVEGQAIEAEASERAALYAHDIAIGQGASQWMVNLRSGVRPILTYGFFLLFAFVEIGGFVYAWQRDIAFDVLIAKLWDADTQIIFASIISFHFGGRAFKGGKD
jgi:hypothetical protein